MHIKLTKKKKLPACFEELFYPKLLSEGHPKVR